MGFLRRIACILRFLHGAASDGDGDEDDNPAAEKGGAQPPPSANRRGFSVQVPVATTRHHDGPVLAPCSLGEGGVQGFKWCGERLKVDEDGDVADEFLDEALLPEEAPRLDNHTALPVFNAKCSAQPAAVKNQVIVADGSVRHRVEHRGRLRWV